MDISIPNVIVMNPTDNKISSISNDLQSEGNTEITMISNDECYKFNDFNLSKERIQIRITPSIDIQETECQSTDEKELSSLRVKRLRKKKKSKSKNNVNAVTEEAPES